ncbi:AraC family transcriptional regulator [Alkalimarinus alittae]|uniref:AraC family transcriptional regulator n=1 Tax=Alkalimarinus alittae TaxID=2961619 RepID=A0ABY6N355_9ALTE|nr:AraC family transcriptional regulator [Alkalimarinus alittae]UZE96524.1 AraC family transcriptional regulator [Alkalimarinus alittae]
MTATCYSTTATPYHGEVALSYWQTLVRVAEREGVDPEKIRRILAREEAHLLSSEEKVPPEGPNAAILVAQYIEVMKLGLAACDDFGLEVGRSVTPGSYPILGMTLLSCQSLKQVLEQVVRYESLNHDLGISRLDIRREESAYCWAPNPLYFPDPKGGVSFNVVVSVFAGVRTFAPWLINQHFPIKKICFMAAEPKNSRLYKSFFGAEIQYNQPANAMIVNSDILSWPVLNGDAASFDALTAHAEKLLNGREGQRDLIWQLKSALPEALRKQAYRVEEIAGALNMSARTLQRKLKERGCSYKQLLDDVRKQLAEFYLTEARVSMSEIAFLVGYQEQSSFNHAFKVWNGLSPTAYREQKSRATE